MHFTDWLNLLCTHGVEDDRAIVELLVARLESLEDGLGHVSVVCIGLDVHVSARIYITH